MSPPGAPAQVYYYVTKKHDYAEAVKHARDLDATDSVNHSENYLPQWAYNALPKMSEYYDALEIKEILEGLGYGAKSSKSNNKTGYRGKRSRRSLSSDRAGSGPSTSGRFGVGSVLSAVTGGQEQRLYEGGSSLLPSTSNVTDI